MALEKGSEQCRPSSRQLLRNQQQIRHLSGKPVYGQVKRTLQQALQKSLFLRNYLASRLHLVANSDRRKQRMPWEPQNLFQFENPDLLANVRCAITCGCIDRSMSIRLISRNRVGDAAAALPTHLNYLSVFN